MPILLQQLQVPLIILSMKNKLTRVIFFGILIFFGMTGPVVLFVLLASIYTFLYLGVELIVLAAAIDAYFGYGSDTAYVYTLFTAGGIFTLQILRTYLKIYDK